MDSSTVPAGILYAGSDVWITTYTVLCLLTILYNPLDGE